MHSDSPSLGERIISCLSYLSAGWIGLIYCILLYFLKKSAGKFLRYNVFQSIFISLLYFVLCMTLGFICNILLVIPFINYLVSQILLIFNRPIFFEYSLIQTFVIGLVLYMAICSIVGRYPRIYKISKIIDYAVR